MSGVQTKVQAGPAQSFTPAGAGLLHRKCTLCNTPGLVEYSEREEDGLILQRSPANQAEPSVVPPIVHEVLHSPGQPLDSETRVFTESRFGHDFSRVSVHSTRPGMIQTRLKINKPGDSYEQEADRVADQVMRMPNVQRQPEEEPVQTKSMITPLVQRQIDEEVEEEEDEEDVGFLQTKELPGQSPEVTQALSSSIQNLRGGGQPLPEFVRAYFEPRFGHDFSQVRVHTDASTADIARDLNARAFTIGSNVVFGAGQYAPETTDGKRLLAHELMHVLQQRAIPSPRRPQFIVNQKAKISDEVHLVAGGNPLFGKVETITTQHYVPTAIIQTEQRPLHSSCDRSAHGLPHTFNFRINQSIQTRLVCLSGRHMRIQIQANWDPRPSRGTVPTTFSVSLYRATGRQEENRRGTRTIPIDGQLHTEEFRDQGAGNYYLIITRSRALERTSRLAGSLNVEDLAP